MAGDWIKMRVWLSRDPRVIRMADYLSEQRPFMNWLTDPVRQSCIESAYEHVTRNVISALCVTGLLVTWGTAREQGDRDGDDLVLSHCDKYTIDSITDIECFGEAMEFVGWLHDIGDGKVTFPKFFKDNESPDERHKRQNAERQARFRANKQDKSNGEVTQNSNVTVTPREEKRREENKEVNPQSLRDCPPTDYAKPKKKSSGVTLTHWLADVKSKGEKIVSDYKPVWAYCEKVGLPADWIEIAWLRFHDRYTTDEKGKRKRYTDWRRVFLRAVEENWLGLWFWSERDNQFRLSTVGIAADMATKEAA